MAFDAILWAKLKSSASLVDGKVPSEQLPSYIDEVIEVASYSDLPQPGVAGKIYYTLDTRDSYRWGSSAYIIVNSGNIDGLAKVEDLSDLESTIEATYAKKTELVGLASESFVNEKIAEIQIPDVDLSNYYKKNETYSATQTDEKISAAIAAIEFPQTDLTGYATEKFVKDEIANINFPNPDLSEYAKRSELPVVPTDISAFNNDIGYLTEHQSLDGYAKLTDIPTDYITEIPEEYVTETELANYATKVFVEDAITNLDIPSTDLSEYAKIIEVEKSIEDAVTGLATEAQLAHKADDILFTENYVVGNAIGAFAIGDSVKDLSIKTILIKLLNLTVAEPETPDKITTENIIEGYTSQDGGKTFTAVNNAAVITDDSLESKDLNGVFEDAEGNVGYQIQYNTIENDSVAKVYIDPQYEIVEIQSWNPALSKWTTFDSECWVWSESPTLETVSISDGETTQMRVYTYNIDYADERGSCEFRFVVQAVN